MDNFQRLHNSEIVLMDVRGENNKRLMLRPEQKSEAVLKSIISKFTHPGELVCDPFGGALSTARACLQLPLQRRCIIGDSDPPASRTPCRSSLRCMQDNY